jgi:hypothetical protein
MQRIVPRCRPAATAIQIQCRLACCNSACIPIELHKIIHRNERFAIRHTVHDNLNLQKLALTSPTSNGRSVSIVRTLLRPRSLVLVYALQCASLVKR